jgi:hypothetical protein
MAVISKRESVEVKDHAKVYGDYNDAPPNFKEITEEEFAQSMFFTYSPEYTEYRQILLDPDSKRKEALSVKLYFFFDGNGFGMANDYWAKKVRYFRFKKCDHKAVELSPVEARKKGIVHHGNCYHVLECSKCGYIHSYDSSG